MLILFRKKWVDRMVGEYVWLIIAILSIIVIFFSVFFMILSKMIFNVTMKRTGSSLTWESLDERGKVAMRFIIDRTNWDELWFGILGLFCAWGLQSNLSFAWELGVFWSVMLIVSGIIIALNEIVVLGWKTVCLQTIDFLVVGGIALVCLLAVKKEFTKTPK